MPVPAPLPCGDMASLWDVAEAPRNGGTGSLKKIVKSEVWNIVELYC